MEKSKSFQFCLLAVLFMLLFFGCRGEDVGRYQLVSVCGSELGSALLIIDTKTGEVKLVNQGFYGFQLGIPFTKMDSNPLKKTKQKK